MSTTLENMKKIRVIQKMEAPEQETEEDDGTAELIEKAGKAMQK
jgi:hypothetical protein